MQVVQLTQWYFIFCWEGSLYFIRTDGWDGLIGLLILDLTRQKYCKNVFFLNTFWGFLLLLNYTHFGQFLGVFFTRLVNYHEIVILNDNEGKVNVYWALDLAELSVPWLFILVCVYLTVHLCNLLVNSARKNKHLTMNYFKCLLKKANWCQVFSSIM